ncbi:MAG: lysine--tRNA ligase [Planctomycetota bacterium]|nr:lysine--tRNA ligase [Planctomycetota bacterium]MDI6787470.1 lysine--tRNA ligase [Planctomycetota bacterium]
MNKEYEIRVAKLEKLKALGINPYAYSFPSDSESLVATILGRTGRTCKQPIPIKTVLGNFREDFSDHPVTIAGRIIAMRSHGKVCFLDLKDQTDKIQLYIKKDKICDREYQIYELLDIGDIIGVEGTLFKTKTGETTILVSSLILLSKALLPLPEKWHGLQDVNLRYRQRYLDLIANSEVRRTFTLRSCIIRHIREYMQEQGFMEVETPMMQPIPGGATAQPFITHHNTLEMDLYLRIAPELYLKRLLVGGFERVYEINRNFRNEGISTQHNPEFTMLEAYRAYADYNDMMSLTENVIVYTASKILPSLKTTYEKDEIDLTPPWQRKKYLELFQEYCKTGWENEKEVIAKAKTEQIPTEKRTYEDIASDLFERLVEPHLTGPIFITDYPRSLCPLAKTHRDNPELAERFELYISRMEIANAFSELNDPLEQKERFLAQLKNKAEGMVSLDEDYINALMHAMPPAGGLGIGIDRVVMILTNNPSIRDVILFPTLRNI